jgi:hypothetical protein
MVKPIKATLALRGDDAKKFIESWLKEIKNPSKGRIKFIKEAEKNKAFIRKRQYEQENNVCTFRIKY